jgi:hypothetical protein
MGLQHNQYNIIQNGLTTFLDPANQKSLVYNQKNLMYLNEKNASNYFLGAVGATATYESSTDSILWNNPQYESWGTYIHNWSIFNYTLDITKQHTLSFEWRMEGSNPSNFICEIVTFVGTEGVTSANLRSSSTLQLNGWWKFSHTFTPVNSGRNAYVRVITGPAHGIPFRFRWRQIQLEQNSFATSFVSNSITTNLLDMAGTQNATIINPAYDSSNFGALYLDGTSSYVDTNNRYLSKYNTGTISMWVKSRDVSKINHFYHEADTGDGFGGEPEVHFTINGGVVTASLPYGEINNLGFTSAFWNSNGFAVSNNIWFNAVLTYSISSNNAEATFNFYMNGQPNGSGTVPRPNINFTQNAFLGRPRYTTDTRSLTGSLGAFLFYNRVLSGTEILENYNALKGRYGL